MVIDRLVCPILHRHWDYGAVGSTFRSHRKGREFDSCWFHASLFLPASLFLSGVREVYRFYSFGLSRSPPRPCRLPAHRVQGYPKRWSVSSRSESLKPPEAWRSWETGWCMAS